MSTLFISHSTEDKTAANDLYRRLVERGYERPFLDSHKEAGIGAGENWEQVLYDRLKDCRAMLVLVSRNWIASKWCFAELVYAKAMGKQIFPILLEDCPLGPELGAQQGIMLHTEGATAWDRLWTALSQVQLGAQDDFAWDPERCPYPGFPAFTEDYAGVFFGRENEIQHILETLNTMRTRGEPRFLIVVGGSGSGKSSLLRAGVLPRLKLKSADDWLVLPTLRFGHSPDADLTLTDLLARHIADRSPDTVTPHPDWKDLRRRFSQNDAEAAASAFLDATLDLSSALEQPNATTLLVIDQFEELLAPSAGAAADRFLAFLNAVFQGRSNGQLLAIATVRSDHIDSYERHPHAMKAPSLKSWRLEPLPRERLADVIRKPAECARVSLTDELVERLKLDTPNLDSLPLLAFTLEKLYRIAADDKVIAIAEYDAIGRMEGAIRQTVEGLLSKVTMTPEIENALRLSFVRHLAQVNESGQVVRRRAQWREIPESARPLLESFVAERLLATSEEAGGTIEVAHEALFRCWDKLRDQWLPESIAVLRWRRDVERDRSSAIVHGTPWRGLSRTQLDIARRWPKEHREELIPDELTWIFEASWRQKRWKIGVGVVVAIVITAVLWGLFKSMETKDAEDRTKTALEKQVGLYETLPNAVAFWATPRLRDGYPFTDSKTTEQHIQNFTRDVDRLPVNSKIFEKVEKLRDAIERGQPSQSNSGTASWTEDMRHEAEQLARLASREWIIDREAQGLHDDPELGRAFLRKRKNAYKQAIETVECLMAVERIESSELSKKCYLDFYQLYWGGLLIVEDQDVIGYMVKLGKIGNPLVQWAQGTNADDDPKAKFDELATKFVDMLNNQKIPQIDKCLAGTGPLDKCCISFEDSSNACN